ncbi:MAG: GNAT family N-acetyltransferase [Armatimonadetes bacterium]|nr:GNAT family N-acetyltransferase [Armatimonadota bacterium]
MATDLPDGFVLRPAVNADGAAVRALVFGVLAEYGLAPDPAGTDTDLDDLEGFYAGAGGCFELLLAPDGQVVGCWGLRPHGAGTVELRKMYLRPDMRGRGLGRMLLSRALSAAESLGTTRIQLETAGVLHEAVGLYTAFGFQPVAAGGCAARCDLAMALDLPTK